MIYLTTKNNDHSTTKWHIFEVKSIDDEKFTADEYVIDMKLNYRVSNNDFVWTKNVVLGQPKKVTKKYNKNQYNDICLRGFGYVRKYDDIDTAVSEATKYEIRSFEKFLLH